MTTTIQTYPPKVPEVIPDARIFTAEQQAFLVGDTLFLRGLEEEDARRSTGWYDSVYPINPERAAGIIKGYVTDATLGEDRMVACRRSDGVPVGSLTISRWPGNYLFAQLRIHVDPALPGGEQIRSEMLRMIVGWGQSEAEMPTILCEFDSGQRASIAAAEALGMHHDATWREQIWRDGAWRDRLLYAAYHPVWARRLGDPPPGIDFAMATDDPQRWRPRQQPTFGPVDGLPAANAVLIGPRVSLRPLEMEDAAEHVASFRRERETFFDDGRYPGSVLAVANRIRTLSKDEHPSEVRFAVCLRETGQYIGTNGIADINRIHRTGETSSFFLPEHRNSGYGSEAKQLLLAWCFDTLGLHSVTSWVWGPNTRSQAALRRQGYRDAGRSFWEGTKDGEFTHSCTFDLLADEWRAMTNRAAHLPGATR